MIRGIVFDCFGVLTADLWHEFLADLPENVDTQAIIEVHRAYNAGRITKKESHDQILTLAGKEFTEMEDMGHRDVAKNTSLLRYIQELAKTYKIGLLSNAATNWVRDSFLTKEEQALFNTMVLSYEVGFNKPDQKMYATVCDRLELLPSEILYVDDMLPYCEAAASLGMQAIQYLNFEQCKEAIEEAIT